MDAVELPDLLLAKSVFEHVQIGLGLVLCLMRSVGTPLGWIHGCFE